MWKPMVIDIRPKDRAKRPTAMCRIFTGPVLTMRRTLEEKSVTIPDMKLMRVNVNAINPER